MKEEEREMDSEIKRERYRNIEIKTSNLRIIYCLSNVCNYFWLIQYKHLISLYKFSLH